MTNRRLRWPFQILLLVTVLGALAVPMIRKFDSSPPPAPAPESPVKLLGEFQTAVGVTGSGSTAYLTTTLGELKIMDMSNPANPALLGTLDGEGGMPMPWHERISCHVSGSILYLEGGRPGFQIIDASNPAAPKLLGRYQGGIGAVAVEGSFAFGVSGSELRILDISDPATPTFLGLHESSSFSSARNQYGRAMGLSDVEVSGSIAYIAAGEAGLLTLDVSDPASPVQLGTCDVGYDPIDRVLLSGLIAYLPESIRGASEENDDGSANQSLCVRVVDVSDPKKPELVASYPTPGGTRDMAITGNLAVILQDWAHLEVLDISDPKAPRLLDSFNLDGLAEIRGVPESVAISGSILYIGFGHIGFDDMSDAHITILDISGLLTRAGVEAAS